MSNYDPEETITYQYRFTFKNGVEKTFTVHFNAQTLDLLQAPKDAYPDWTNLDYQQCLNCPLDPDKRFHCPIAINLVDMIDFFKDFPSFEQVKVLIKKYGPQGTHLDKQQAALAEFLTGAVHGHQRLPDYG